MGSARGLIGGICGFHKIFVVITFGEKMKKLELCEFFEIFGGSNSAFCSEEGKHRCNLKSDKYGLIHTFCIDTSKSGEEEFMGFLKDAIDLDDLKANDDDGIGDDSLRVECRRNLKIDTIM